MRFFVDTADVDQIRKANDMGVICGVTTKPEEERTGMGFSFMEAFMDQVEVISKQGEGTTVIMTKKIGDQDKLNG